MKFRIDSEEMLGRLKERSAQLEDTLGLSLPTVAGHTSFSELYEQCCNEGLKEQASLGPEEFNKLAQNTLDNMVKGKVSYTLMKDTRLLIPEAFKESIGDSRISSDGTACIYFSFHVQVLQEEEATAAVSAVLEVRAEFGQRLAYVEQILKGKKTRILSKLFGEKIVAKVTARTPLTYQGKMLITDEYIPEWYLKLEKDESLESCMSHTASWYGLEDYEHPTLAYEGLKTTYLGLICDLVKGKVVGRTIVKYKRRDSGENYLLNNRTYGSAVAHRVSRESTSGSFNELTMKRIDSDDGGILCPYVDGLHDDGYEIGTKYIVTGGDYQSDYETGRISEERQWCNYYEEYVSSGQEMTYVDGFGYVCEDALENNFCYSEYRERYLHLDDAVWIESECDWYHIDDVFCCEHSDEYYPLDDKEAIQVDGREYDIASENVAGFVEDCLDDSDLIVNDGTGEVLFKRDEQEEESDAA